jgi:acetyl-CoA carboxylase biotin carboxyl carrier protein
MSTSDNQQSSPDRAMVESVWAEARDLIRKLEGTTVQRFAVAAGEYKIEIERGAPVAAAPAAAPASDAPVVQPATFGLPSSAGRGASGVFMFEPPPDTDSRVPVLAPLVGTFYSASQPGAKPFVEVGDSVEAGQTVCIVEAMKMMNEVVASDSGKVAEIACENGDWVEFEQVLIYIEPSEG